MLECEERGDRLATTGGIDCRGEHDEGEFELGPQE